VISRICEEFHCLPGAALEAIEEDVGGLLFKIIDLRSYARAKKTFEEGQKESDISKRPSGPDIDRVTDIVGELMVEAFNKRKEK
jgi:hypothetical protein